MGSNCHSFLSHIPSPADFGGRREVSEDSCHDGQLSRKFHFIVQFVECESKKVCKGKAASIWIAIHFLHRIKALEADTMTTNLSVVRSQWLCTRVMDLTKWSAWWILWLQGKLDQHYISTQLMWISFDAPEHVISCQAASSSHQAWFSCKSDKILQG